MGIKPASRKTDSGTAPIDLHGSGLGWTFVAETIHEPRIRDLAWSAQARLAQTLARPACSAADDRPAFLYRFFGHRDRGRRK